MTISSKTTLIKAAEDKKAENIECIDTKGISDICDQVFICSGQNPKHTQAISTHIKEKMQKDQGLKPSFYEGFEEGEWILIDYVNVVAHVFRLFLWFFLPLLQQI